MKVIAVTNQKGGCGKTTLAINLSAALAQLDKRVLLADLDPQCHASVGLKVNIDHLEKSVYDLLLAGQNSAADIEKTIIPISRGVDLLPSQAVLNTIEPRMAGIDGRENRLKQALEQIPGRYDYVLIDCPSNIGILSLNALRACQLALVPVDACFFSAYSLNKLKHAIELLATNYEQKIEIKVVVNMYHPHAQFCEEVLHSVKEHVGQNGVYKTTIRYSVKVQEATRQGKSIIDFNKSSSLADDFMNLAQEIALEGYAAESEASLLQILKSAQKQAQVVFTLAAPTANDVRVVGDFNGWDLTQSWPLQKTESGIWKNTFQLLPGDYRYEFVVDGEHVPDPSNALNVRSQEGRLHSLLTVG